MDKERLWTIILVCAYIFWSLYSGQMESRKEEKYREARYEYYIEQGYSKEDAKDAAEEDYVDMMDAKQEARESMYY